jgi:hypothetical protein
LWPTVSLLPYWAAVGGGIIEHPGLPFKPEAPSIFLLRQTNWFEHSPAVKRFDFKQSIHGQYATKPTGFLTLRMQGIKEFLYKRQTDFGSLEFTGSMTGKHADGSWNTSRAKEYTPSLCLAVAKAMHAALSSRTDPPNEVCTALADCLVGFDPMVQYDRFNPPFDPYQCQNNLIGQDCMLFNSNSHCSS